MVPRVDCPWSDSSAANRMMTARVTMRKLVMINASQERR
jgi:hypothetical protein